MTKTTIYKTVLNYLSARRNKKQWHQNYLYLIRVTRTKNSLKLVIPITDKKHNKR